MMAEQIPMRITVPTEIPSDSEKIVSNDGTRIEGLFIPASQLTFSPETGEPLGIKSVLHQNTVAQIVATYREPAALPAPEPHRGHPVLTATGILAAAVMGVSGWAYTWAEGLNAQDLKPSNSSVPPVVSASSRPSAPVNSPTTGETPSGSPEPAAASPLQCVQQNFTPKQQVGQLLLLGIQGESSKKNNLKEVAKVFNEYRVGGVVLMSAPKDIYEDNNTLFSFIRSQDVAPTVATDQEGGSVQRIGYPTSGKKILSQEEVGSLSEVDREKYIEDVVKPMYQFLASKGITMLFGPVADLSLSGEGQGPLPGRTFSTDPDIVAKNSAAYIQAASDAGLYSTMKHFPGLGDAMRYDGKEGATDGGPMFTPPWSEIKEWTLKPYEAQKDNPRAGVMMGTHTVPGLTTPDVKKQAPAALSKAAVDAAKQAMGQETYIITDDINTPAIKEYMKSKKIASGAVSKAALEALEAGVSGVLIVAPNATGTSQEAWAKQLETLTDEITATMEAKPEFAKNTQEQVVRILAMKGVDPCAVASN